VLRHGAAAGSVELTLNATTPFEWHPRPEAGKPASAAAVAVLGGAWGFNADAPLKLMLGKGEFSAQGKLVLDQAAIAYTGAEPTFSYNKPAATPCRVAFSISQGNDGILRVPALEVTGGPLGFSL